MKKCITVFTAFTLCLCVFAASRSPRTSLDVQSTQGTEQGYTPVTLIKEEGLQAISLPVSQIYEEENAEAFKTPNIGHSSYEMPITGVIEPTDLVFTPIINIDTLFRDEEIRSKQNNVKSSIVQQEIRKDEVKEEIKTNSLADTTLDDTSYGPTSGLLAENANKNAFTYAKSSNSFNNAILVYDYIEGQIYELVTSPKAITEIKFNKGEKIMGSPLIKSADGDWAFTLATSIENGNEIQHLHITPKRVGLDTSLTIHTNQRTYFFRIASFEHHYLTSVSFRYPYDDGPFYHDATFDYYNPDTAVNTSFQIDVTKMNYNYAIKATKGRPAWTPVDCFSDDLKTYIYFPDEIKNTTEMPSIYLKTNKTEVLISKARPCNPPDCTIYQVDTVLSQNQMFILRSNKEIVQIEKSTNPNTQSSGNTSSRSRSR